jgi:hypothetical protein
VSRETPKPIIAKLNWVSLARSLIPPYLRSSRAWATSLSDPIGSERLAAFQKAEIEK